MNHKRRIRLNTLVAPITTYFRVRRMKKFQQLFSITEETRILDIGGTVDLWSLLKAKPQITILNLYPPVFPVKEKNVTWVVGDARDLPFKDKEFDIAFSNSVIEHVGDINSQKAFAKEVARVGRDFYIQTPNKWFPIEPHFMAPFIHFLPKSLQKNVVKNFTVWGILCRPSTEDCISFVDEIQLIDQESMKQFFPSSQIIKEKFLGFTKSLIAIKKWSPD